MEKADCIIVAVKAICRLSKAFILNVQRSLFYWLNRRSQKKSYSWAQFRDMLKEFPLARPRIYVSIYRG